jgi:hypothetical protein
MERELPLLWHGGRNCAFLLAFTNVTTIVPSDQHLPAPALGSGTTSVPTLNCRQIIHAASALSRLVRAWLIWERVSAPAAFHL